MGAVIVKKELADEFETVSEKEEEFPHGFTAGGHPVGCAIALKAIDVIINEGLLENVRNVSPYFHERLQEFNAYNHIGETRGIGLMGALEMVKDKEKKTPFYQFVTDAETLASIGFIQHRKRPDREVGSHSYQRVIKSSRLKSIAQYINSKNTRFS